MANHELFLLRYDLSMDAGSDQAEIMVYGQITNYKYKTDGSEITASDFDKLLKEAAEKGAKKLHIRINSPGGNVWQAVAMRTMLMTDKFDEISVSIEGLCASAATLLCCLPNVHVTIAEGSEFMIHNPSGIAFGSAAEMRKQADRLEKMEGDVREIYANRSGKGMDEIKDMMDAETWMTAREAVEAGFCDELLEATPIAACATEEQIAAMQSMYRNTPQMTAIKSDDTPNPPNVSPTEAETTAAAVTENTSTQEEEHEMDLKDITMEQLRQENPALLNAAIAEERQRVQDIDDLTLPGYEQMAADAMRNGTSAMDFQKQIVKAQREKGATFMQQRQQETAPAEGVQGGDPGQHDMTDEDELKAYIKEMNAYAAQAKANDGGMY